MRILIILDSGGQVQIQSAAPPELVNAVLDLAKSAVLQAVAERLALAAAPAIEHPTPAQTKELLR